MLPEDNNIILSEQDSLKRNDIPQDDDFDKNKALYSNDEDFQEEDSDYTYNPTLEMVKSVLPSINRQLSQKLPKDIKATDKILSKISYCVSATLRPLDYSLKTLYDTKPAENKKEALEVWTILEQSMLTARSLLLDSLSHTTMKSLNSLMMLHGKRKGQNRLIKETTTKQTKTSIQTNIEAEVEDSIGNLEPQTIGRIFGSISHKGVSLSTEYKCKVG
ncbi:13799_t:CDS:2 [Dentiscutata erythropus]|uniref:13799_t:CDS:1 n=1 Tax=Dentiscutata erythropus TaxID=1348616 RepID=A0A9N9H9N3_9GLOM|nr:13799_t:CDS:2 [Dentiscutata erythropus]